MYNVRLYINTDEWLSGKTGTRFIIIIIIIINIQLYTATYRKTRTVAVHKLKWGIK